MTGYLLFLALSSFLHFGTAVAIRECLLAVPLDDHELHVSESSVLEEDSR